ncbi:type III-A CRISPR-associated RAMP protein Csm4 [Wolinella succinogenes]|uniref:type III-A CRISPR-associated RAMP protein Csm4 n=1 Tax=Wolinella succinogenes TaxID=844 RepID=UPI00240A1F8B|nr:hypothetical protein [Wolinella succinogenes]
MNLYKTTINPIARFATPLRGDTMFGQMCWAIRYKFGEKRLKELLANYQSNPFLIVSDGFTSGYLPKPKIPSRFLGEGEDKKANRKKIWLSLEDLTNGDFHNGKTPKEVGEDTSQTVMRNSINYLTFTTDDSGAFAPYGVNEMRLSKKDIYFLIDEEQFGFEELKIAFEAVSLMGYGKDSTVGKGRFEIGDFQKVEIKEDSKTLMALSPFSLEGLVCKNCFYEPFVRFGKKGGDRANENPFKKPLLLADCGGVVVLNEKPTKRYIGKAITNFSTHSDIVHQGYAIALPIKDIDE